MENHFYDMFGDTACSFECYNSWQKHHTDLQFRRQRLPELILAYNSLGYGHCHWAHGWTASPRELWGQKWLLGKHMLLLRGDNDS